MLNSLFSVVEHAPTVFEKTNRAGLGYRLTLYLCKKEGDLFFLSSPGFRPPLPFETKRIETIVEIVFSDLLIDVFNSEEYAVIGQFLRKSPGCIGFAFDKPCKIKDSILGLSKNKSHCRVSQFLNGFYKLAKAATETKMPPETLPGAAGGYSQLARRLEKVKKFIAENYRKEIKVNEVAEIAGVTPGNFARFFKQHIGMTLCDYVNGIRVDKAYQLLQTTDDTVMGIAYSCGFVSHRYFTDVFRRYKGKTPGEARING